MEQYLEICERLDRHYAAGDIDATGKAMLELAERIAREKLSPAFKIERKEGIKRERDYDDAIQDACLEACKSIESYKATSDGPFAAWCVVVMKRAVYKVYRERVHVGDGDAYWTKVGDKKELVNIAEMVDAAFNERKCGHRGKVTKHSRAARYEAMGFYSFMCGQRHTKPRMNEYVRLHDEGLSVEEVARELGIEYDALRKSQERWRKLREKNPQGIAYFVEAVTKMERSWNQIARMSYLLTGSAHRLGLRNPNIEDVVYRGATGSGDTFPVAERGPMSKSDPFGRITVMDAEEFDHEDEPEVIEGIAA